MDSRLLPSAGDKLGFPNKPEIEDIVALLFNFKLILMIFLFKTTVVDTVINNSKQLF